MNINEIKACLQSGGIGVLQCDTILGLVSAMTPDGADRIRAVKRRPDTRPFIVLIPGLEYLEKLSSIPYSEIEALCREFWPGPLTIVLPKRDEVPDSVTGGLMTVGIRFPKFAPLNELLNLLNAPIISTSVNVSGEPEISSVVGIPPQMIGELDFCSGMESEAAIGVASTVLDCTQRPFKMLREGAISKDQIENVLRRPM